MSDGETIYFLDDDENIIGKLQNENVLSLVVTSEDSGPKILNLVFSFKYKCDQGVIVADVAFVSDFIGENKLPVMKKNRQIEFETDEVFASNASFSSIGQIKQNESTLEVNIPSLGIEEICRDAIPGNKHDFPIFHLITRKVH